MFDKIINNYYFSNIIGTCILILICLSLVDFMKKYNIIIKDKINFKSFDFRFFIKILFFSFFIRIFLEQIQKYFNFSSDNYIFDITFLSILVYFTTRCIIAPIVEEIIFRFSIYEFIKLKTGAIFSLIVSSIIFSCIHGYSFFDTFILFSITVIWCYSYYKSDNLIYPILCHFFHNICALVSILIFLMFIMLYLD